MTDQIPSSLPDMGVRPASLPPSSLLAQRRDMGDYTDCFVCELGREIALPAYVVRFYTSWLFKLERFVLRWLVRKPSTDAEAVSLSLGERDAFAAWALAARTENQILMQDYQGKTCSWLMVEPIAGGTRLYFGSSIVRSKSDGEMSIGFRLLLPFHRIYSVGLLNAAKSGLEKG